MEWLTLFAFLVLVTVYRVYSFYDERKQLYKGAMGGLQTYRAKPQSTESRDSS